MNQELFFSESQWRSLKEFAQCLSDAYYHISGSKFNGAEERFSLALKAATYNLDCDVHDPLFFAKVANGIRRLVVTDKVTVYGDGPEEFGIHIIQSIGQMVRDKVSRELARTGLHRRLHYSFCYRCGGTDFFYPVKDGEEYPLFTVRFRWQEKDTLQLYDCSVNSLLMWLARIPCDTKIAEAVKIFKPFLSSINCVKIPEGNEKSRRGWWNTNTKTSEE